MRVTRVIFAVFIAAVGLMLVLPQATAESRRGPQLAEAPHRVYLAMVTVDAGSSKRASTSVPNGAISVVAQAGLSCNDNETVPVRGARITVIADDSSRIAMTDETGYALFNATQAPAVIQIEWPVGFLPCPNSRPIVELPSGAGEVSFTARVGH